MAKTDVFGDVPHASKKASLLAINVEFLITMVQWPCIYGKTGTVSKETVKPYYLSGCLKTGSSCWISDDHVVCFVRTLSRRLPDYGTKKFRGGGLFCAAARGSVGFFTMTWDMGKSPSKIDWEIFKTVVWKWSFGSHKAAIIGRFTQ